MAQRDTVAFTEFVAARSPALFRTAYLIVGDHGLAQDLVQEALTKTYVAWPRLREVGKAEAYTRKAITTTYISWWRRKAWRAERPRDDVPESGPMTQREHGSDVVDRAWVWQELQALPPRQRTAIVLRYYEDLTEAQTAQLLGVSAGTVKSQASRAMAKLRELLAADAAGAAADERGGA